MKLLDLFEQKIDNSKFKISKNGLNFIKCKEGFSSKEYLDSNKVKVIGYGTKLKNGDKTISEKEAESRLLLFIEDNVHKHLRNPNIIKVQLNQRQFDALCSLLYNIGIYRSVVFLQHSLKKSPN